MFSPDKKFKLIVFSRLESKKSLKHFNQKKLHITKYNFHRFILSFYADLSFYPDGKTDSVSHFTMQIIFGEMLLK